MKTRRWNRRVREVCAACGISFWPGNKVCDVAGKTYHVKCVPAKKE